MRLANVRGGFVLAIAGCLLAANSSSAQTPPPAPASAQAAAMADAWSALAKGDLARSRAILRDTLQTSPLSVSTLALMIEIEIVTGGSDAGLEAYERWLGNRRVESPYALRRLATAFLQEAVRLPNSGPARGEALKALVADGDPVAMASISAAAEDPSADPLLLAPLGNERAVETLIAGLPMATDKVRRITALADSGSRLAIQPLIALLSTGTFDERAAALDGLGQLGAQEAIGAISPLLEEGNFTVRLAAARALSRLGSSAGVPLLDQLLGSEHAPIRLSAAEALAAMPGTSWLGVARALTSDPDQSVRLGAARLIAPYDRELAETVLFALGQAENLAIREEAARIFAERVANDFAALRLLMKGPDRVTAVRSAGRILALVR